MRALVDGLDFVPRTCTWELTLRCDLRCGHCGSSAGRPREREMPRETALRVAGELAALGCRRLSLSGGEPTLSPYWEEVAAESARLGVRVNMITNGLSASRGLVRRAQEAGLVSLGASLDGLEAEHDRNRGHRGLFGKVMGLLDDCAAVGLPAGVITTITRDNFRQLEAIHDLLKGRVYVWQVQIGARMGNLARHCQRQIAPEDLLEVVPAVARLIQKGEVRIHVADNIGYYGPYEEVLRTRRTSPVPCWVGCYAGCRHLGIESDGGVKGCLSIQSTSATEGNLQGEGLADIWWREGAFAYNRDFTPSDLTGFCRTCVHAGVCRGGCLSMRSCEGGGDNPFCYHRVLTLAERRERPGLRKYIPMFVAPAAIVAAFGLAGTSCGGAAEPTGDADYDTSGMGDDAYGFPVPDGDSDVDSDGVGADAYGIPAPDGDADSDVVSGDAYGIPAPDGDGDADTDAASWYGMPDPDADLPADYYGMPDPDAGADADTDAASWYGMPDPGEGE